MNEELKNNALKALDEERLEEGDKEMLEMVLAQYEKYPESKRIENTIRELVKRTRIVVTLSKEDHENAAYMANKLDEIFSFYPNISIPTKSNRDYDNLLEACIRAAKEKMKENV